MKRLVLVLSAVGLLCAPACKKKDEKKDEPTPAAAKVPDQADPGKADPAKPAADPKLVERGKYLATIGGCPLCHTPMGPKGPDMDRMMAGGMEFTEPFGTWRSLNITPHDETGIGKWTDQQLDDAIRKGVRPDGDRLFPIMPYMFYNKLSNDDTKALIAYLRSVPPVENKVERAMDLKMPRDFPVPDPAGTAPDMNDPVKYGDYLATFVHCSGCHVPFDKEKMMPDYSKPYHGGMQFEVVPPFGKGVVYAPNLTSDEETGIGKWTEEQIVSAIKGMKRPDGSVINFPMALFAQSWTFMKDEDAAAIAKFLKSLPPAKNKVERGKVEPAGPPPGAPGGDAPPKKG